MGATFVGLTGAYQYDGLEVARSTDFPEIHGNFKQG
jgi:hypothetical protein